MNFAVLEYTSKTGKIWHHTPEHPNYLADPVKEIDPTSFGCYVSALAGEHIPLTSLILGPDSKTSKPIQLYRKAVKRITGDWPQYNIDYLRQFDALLIVHQLSDAHELVSLLKKLRENTKRPLMLGVPTQPFGILKDAFAKDSNAKTDFINFMDGCDVFISIVEDTVDWYQNMTKTKVIYVPQPYPSAFASQNFLPREQKEKTILLAGVTQRDNIKKGHLVATELKKRFPDYEILIPRVQDMDYDFSLLKNTAYKLQPFEKWHDHLKTIAKSMLVINTDFTFTRGRVQTDCAATGTPSLGCNSDGQKDLFPDLFITSDTPVETIVQQAIRLIEDPAYYTSITTQARENLEKYDYKQSAERLTALINSLK